MTEVRIRHYAEGRAAHLAHVPFDQIDSVIPTLKAWGIGPHNSVELVGQFVYEPETNVAYFEIVIEDSE